jgi:hypothetical protein
MSPQDTPSDTAQDELGGAEAEQDNDSLASKLSKELSNWRRQRGTSRPKRTDGGSTNQSEPARTIKVRGHETLVIRKSRLPTKTPANTEQTEQ